MHTTGFNWNAPRDSRPVFSGEEGCARVDYVRSAAEAYDYARLADLVLDGDEFTKDWISIHAPSLLAEVTAELAKKGLGIYDGGGYWLIHALTRCPGCWEDKPISEPCSGCAGMDGAGPEEEIAPDSEDTGAMCIVGFHALSGPPDFCCEGRRRLFEALHGDKPIRQCQGCHGLGKDVYGVCETCQGSGVQP